MARTSYGCASSTSIRASRSSYLRESGCAFSARFGIPPSGFRKARREPDGVDELARLALDEKALLEARAIHTGRSAYNHLLFLAQRQGLPARRVDRHLVPATMTNWDFSDVFGRRDALRRRGRLVPHVRVDGGRQASSRDRRARPALVRDAARLPGRVRLPARRRSLRSDLPASFAASVSALGCGPASQVNHAGRPFKSGAPVTGPGS